MSPFVTGWDDEGGMGAPGDEDFEVVFREMWPSAFALARRVLGDPAEAEDAAAEGMARALVKWERVRDLPYRDAWILRVVSNVAIDRARHRARSASASEATEVVDRTDGQEDLTVLRLALVEALGALPARQREVIVLRHLCGLSEMEVGAVIGISTNSVKKHASRGFVRLRSRLGQLTEEEISVAY